MPPVAVAEADNSHAVAALKAGSRPAHSIAATVLAAALGRGPPPAAGATAEAAEAARAAKTATKARAAEAAATARTADSAVAAVGDKKATMRTALGGGLAFWHVAAAAAALRLALVAYGEWQDRTMALPYTDIDYRVLSDGAAAMAAGGSPYDRPTYRYTPLLAALLVPFLYVPLPGAAALGKVLFCAGDLVAGRLIYALLCRVTGPSRAARLTAIFWLLNPMTFAISTRGNAESIIACLVLATLHLVSSGRVVLGGLAFGIAVHVKLFPVIHAFALLAHLLVDRTAARKRQGLADELHHSSPATEKSPRMLGRSAGDLYAVAERIASAGKGAIHSLALSASSVLPPASTAALPAEEAAAATRAAASLPPKSPFSLGTGLFAGRQSPPSTPTLQAPSHSAGKRGDTPSPSKLSLFSTSASLFSTNASLSSSPLAAQSETPRMAAGIAGSLNLSPIRNRLFPFASTSPLPADACSEGKSALLDNAALATMRASESSLLSSSAGLASRQASIGGLATKLAKGAASKRRASIDWPAMAVAATFVAAAMASFGILTVGSFLVYGEKYVREAILYHLLRKDHRHNFSPYFYLFYTEGAGGALPHATQLLAFIPQVVFFVAAGLKYGRKGLPFAFFISTFVFVTFNKVVTSQYFIWYISLLPMAYVSLPAIRPAKWAAIVAAWVAAQGVWLHYAYKLEYVGENTFVHLWAASLAFLLVNVAIGATFIRHRSGQAVFRAAPGVISVNSPRLL